MEINESHKEQILNLPIDKRHEILNISDLKNRFEYNSQIEKNSLMIPLSSVIKLATQMSRSHSAKPETFRDFLRKKSINGLKSSSSILENLKVCVSNELPR